MIYILIDIKSETDMCNTINVQYPCQDTQKKNKLHSKKRHRIIMLHTTANAAKCSRCLLEIQRHAIDS